MSGNRAGPQPDPAGTGRQEDRPAAVDHEQVSPEPEAARERPVRRPDVPTSEPVGLTRETHPIRVDWIETGLWPGPLGLTRAPGTQGGGVIQKGVIQADVTPSRDLAGDLDRLAREGVNVLAPLIEAHEFELLGITDYHALASARGLEVVACPLRDRDVPADHAAFDDVLDELMEHLLDGRAVVMHGRAGLGRAGLTAACLLTRVGLPPEQATARVRAARPGAIETAAQERFVEDFAAQ